MLLRIPGVDAAVLSREAWPCSLNIAALRNDGHVLWEGDGQRAWDRVVDVEELLYGGWRRAAQKMAG